MADRVGIAVLAVAAGWAIACAGGTTPGSDRGTSPDVPGDPVPTDVPADFRDGGGDVAADEGDPGADAVDTAPESSDPGPDTGPKPFLSARAAATAADLVGGDNAWAAAGRAWVIENVAARFVIQDKGAGVHLGVYGGNLIDADLARTAGQPGNDQFREMFPLVGMRVSSVDSIEVLRDGSDGKEAILRVTGRDAPSGILPDIDPMAMPLGATLVTDYVLEPGEPVLRIRTTVINGDTDPQVTGMMAGDFLTMGGAASVFTPEGGFEGRPAAVTALIGSGRGAAYGYARPSGDIQVPELDANGTIAILEPSLTLPANGGRVAFERLFVVGRDIASVLDRVQAKRGVATHRVSGRVTQAPGGGAIAGALVTAFDAGSGDPSKGGHARSQAAVGIGGDPEAYSLALPPGNYDLVFSAPGRTRTLAVADLTGGDATVDGTMGLPGSFGLEIREKDDSGAILGPLPGKASLACQAGTAGPWAELGEPTGRGLCAVLYNPTGEAMEFPVAPGSYVLTVSRGPEYELSTDPAVVVQEGSTHWARPTLVRSVATPGFQSADLHQHTLGSVDAAPTAAEKVLENVVEGVEIAASTEHDMMVSFRQAIADQGLGDRVMAYDGDEVSVSLEGHFNLFNPTGRVLNADRTPGDLYGFVGGRLYANRTLDDLFAAIQTIPGVDLIQLNHPRDGHAYLTYVGYDPVAGGPVAADRTMFRGFGSIEVKDSIGVPADYLATNDPTVQQWARNNPSRIPVMRDWFSMLNAGYAMTAVAVSDAHNRNEGVGYGRVLVRTGVDDPSDLDAAAVTAALKAQKVSVSNGPFIRLQVDGQDRMGIEEPVTPTGDSLVIQVSVQAPTWIDVDTLEVYANGRPLPITEFLGSGTLMEDRGAAAGQEMSIALPLHGGASSPTMRLDTTLRLFPKVDTWYVVVARGQGSLEPAGRGAPWAYTNPLYVDLGADGFDLPKP